MIWQDVEADFLKLYPQLQTGHLKVGNSSCQWFYLAEGYRDQKNILTFGFLIAKNIEDTRKLLSLVEQQARKLGATQVMGPLNLSTYLDYRVKLDFFSDQPYPGEPQNASWLPNVLVDAGFNLDKKYFSNEFKILQPRIIALVFYGLLNKWKLRHHKYRFISLNQKNVFEYLDQIHQIVREIFFRNHMYLDIPEEVFIKHVKELYFKELHQEASFVVLDPSGKCVAFTLNLKDPANPTRFLFKTLGIRPENSHHNRMMTCLAYEIFKNVWMKHQYCVACLSLETKGIQKKMSTVSHKFMRYGLYSKKLG